MLQKEVYNLPALLIRWGVVEKPLAMAYLVNRKTIFLNFGSIQISSKNVYYIGHRTNNFCSGPREPLFQKQKLIKFSTTCSKNFKKIFRGCRVEKIANWNISANVRCTCLLLLLLLLMKLDPPFKWVLHISWIWAFRLRP